jgi:hypothetical protein
MFTDTDIQLGRHPLRDTRRTSSDALAEPRHHAASPNIRQQRDGHVWAHYYHHQFRRLSRRLPLQGSDTKAQRNDQGRSVSALYAALVPERHLSQPPHHCNWAVPGVSWHCWKRFLGSGTQRHLYLWPAGQSHGPQVVAGRAILGHGSKTGPQDGHPYVAGQRSPCSWNGPHIRRQVQWQGTAI